MHNRHNLHLLAVSEEIPPGLHPVSVRSPQVVSLKSTLRKIVVKALWSFSPLFHIYPNDVRAEMMKIINGMGDEYAGVSREDCKKKVPGSIS